MTEPLPPTPAPPAPTPAISVRQDAGTLAPGAKLIGVSIGTYQEAARPVVTNLHQLPPVASNWTGREAELTAWHARLVAGETRIAALFGMPGVDKTALAIKLAHGLKEQFPDAQFFLNLLGTSEVPRPAREALAHMLRSLGVPPGELPSNEKVSGAVIARRRILRLRSGHALPTKSYASLGVAARQSRGRRRDCPSASSGHASQKALLRNSLFPTTISGWVAPSLRGERRISGCNAPQSRRLVSRSHPSIPSLRDERPRLPWPFGRGG